MSDHSNYDTVGVDLILFISSYQMEQDNDPDPRPVFTGWSYRNLAVHAKAEHKVAWAKLRRNGL